LQKCHEKGMGIFTVKSMAFSVLPKSELMKLPLNDEKVNSMLSVYHNVLSAGKVKAIWQILMWHQFARSCQRRDSAIECFGGNGRDLSAEIKNCSRIMADGTGITTCGRCGSRCEGAARIRFRYSTSWKCSCFEGI